MEATYDDNRPSNYELYGIDGKLLSAFTSEFSEVQFQINQYPEGLYILRNVDQNTSKRVVIPYMRGR